MFKYYQDIKIKLKKLAGLTKAPVVIKEGLTEDEAVLIVTETNLIQRSFSEMLYSERAIVLSEHHKALISQGKRTDLLNEIETMLNLMIQGMRALLAYSAKG